MPNLVTSMTAALLEFFAADSLACKMDHTKNYGHWKQIRLRIPKRANCDLTASCESVKQARLCMYSCMEQSILLHYCMLCI